MHQEARLSTGVALGCNLQSLQACEGAIPWLLKPIQEAYAVASEPFMVVRSMSGNDSEHVIEEG